MEGASTGAASPPVDDRSRDPSSSSDPLDILDLLDDVDDFEQMMGNNSGAGLGKPDAERVPVRARSAAGRAGNTPSRSEVVTVMALARAIKTTAARDAMFAPSAVTVLVCPDAGGVARTLRAFRPAHATTSRPSVVTRSDRVGSSANAANSAWLDVMGTPVPLIIVSPSRPAPDDVFGSVPYLRLDPSHPDVVLAALAETDPSILTRDALIAELPTAAMLRRLDPARMALAFRQPTALAVMRALPPGLVACVPGGADVGAALVGSPRTHAVAFTGSVAAARKVAAAAGHALKPVVIEAGGSDPMLICASAPLDVAAAGATMAAFHLSGQVCTSAERIYVVDAVYDAFVAEMAARTRALRIGHGLGRSKIGPLVGEAARAKVIRLVEDARAKGATVVCGGAIPEGHGPGWFYAPTILTGCTADMAVLSEECFGPVAAIVRVADFDNAIAGANASPFGLGASVFTTDLAEAMAATERLEAGMVWINNPMIDNDALPFGGWKASGLGRELGRQGLDAFRRTKMVVLDHVPVRQGWWYPYPDEWFLDAGGRKHAQGDSE